MRPCPARRRCLRDQAAPTHGAGATVVGNGPDWRLCASNRSRKPPGRRTWQLAAEPAGRSGSLR
ncbi:Hypothetical protein I596_1274 [Dokdonella koreensis DS-123]|uniref:Uncharacterized protein n=1 Tax=Dokdonella koreensis DS-123 TaxID=1300342 RepID=A0A160DT16_9GAMM|nr:Hypothetical protein I596_1274 [Dokdonella koreensis DS-123]